MVVAAGDATLAVGDVLGERSGYVLEPWWVDLFTDALCEPKRPAGDDLNLVFAYLIVQDVVDLESFFSSVPGHDDSMPVLHGMLEVESFGGAGIRAGEPYDVRVMVESMEEKVGRTLGRFLLVTFMATVRGTSSPADFQVRSRVCFVGAA